MSIYKDIKEQQKRHKKRWREETDEYWLISLIEEVSELSLSLRGKHKHSPKTELIQICSICINWLLNMNRKENKD